MPFLLRYYDFSSNCIFGLDLEKPTFRELEFIRMFIEKICIVIFTFSMLIQLVGINYKVLEEFVRLPFFS